MIDETFTLPAAFPFRLDLTVWALRRRKNNRIDRWDGRQYTRVLVLDDEPVRISIAQESPSDDPVGRIFSKGKRERGDRIRDDARRQVQKMLGPGLSLRPFYAMAEKDDLIGALVRRFSGVKPPRFPTVFEALVNAIACQQVSLDAGIVLLDRLAEKFGRRLDGGAYAFPGPEDLAGAPVEEIRRPGFSHQKARAIKELAAAVSEGTAGLAGLEGMSNPEAIECLTALRGIGRWSAEYVLLRGLGRLDTFPGDDVGARNSIQRLFRLDHKPGYGEIKELTSRWHPYQGLVYFHFLLNKLHLNGVI